jgi:hypothetical protein
MPRVALATEHQNHVGIDGGYTYLNVSDKSTPDQGGGFGAHYTYGLTDAFNLTLELQHNIVALNQQLDHPTSPRDRPAYVSNAGIGAQYTLDITRWVPYGGLLVGPYALGGGTIESLKFDFGAQLEVGLDYQLSRKFAVGIAYHEHFILTAMSSYELFFNAFARVEYIWGW